METRIISQAEVAQLLPMGECIQVMATALQALTAGQALNPLRATLRLPEHDAVLATMPAYLGGDDRALGVKVISVFPHNHGTAYDSHQGTVLLFGPEHGELLAIVDATAITGIRTAAASAVATRLLAREDSWDLAILGSGVQAQAHLEAMLLVRPVRRVRVWSLPLADAQRFAEQQSQRFGLRVEFMPTAQQAVEGADLICTCTSAREPVLMGAWVAPGAHINAMGSSVPTTRELDTAAVARARLFVDRRESTLNEAGDFLFPKREGAIGDDHIRGEIGELLLGRVAGRRSADEITLFKSLGLAVEDVASAQYIYHQALQKGIGRALEIGGRRQ